MNVARSAAPEPTEAHPDPTRVIVAVCTYERNEQLRRLLDHLLVAAEAVEHLCRVGVVIADDNADGRAEPVVAEFDDRFDLGTHHRVSGHRNISRARNLAIETALPLADWIAMTDDDCVPDPRWLVEFIECQRRTGSDAVSGRMIRRAPEGSPRWLVEQPFLDQGLDTYEADGELSIASTHCCMMSAQWLRDHPDIRFESRLGRLGGEDMLFFRTAHHAGMRITYARQAFVFEDEPPERLRFGFLVHQALWLGNSTFVTNVEAGDASRGRMAIHGLAQLVRALARPVRQLLTRRRPQFRFTVAMVAASVGTLLGAIGIRIRHH